MRQFLLLTAASFFAASSAAYGQEASSKDVIFEADGATLEGTLHLPSGPGPFPAVVALHGSSSLTRDYSLYDHLAQTVTEAGAAVFIFDRRDAHLPPEERGGNPGYDVMAHDGLAAVRAIGALDSVDEDRIGLWGISQGGWIAPNAYRLDPDAIAFLMLVSSPGVGPAEQMLDAVAGLMRDAGYDEETVERGLHVRRTAYAYFEHEISRDEAQAVVDAHSSESWFELLMMRPSLPQDVTIEPWYIEMQFNPAEIYAYVDAPVILFYGENDPYVPVERSKQVWREALARAGNSAYEIHRVQGTGHSMMIDEPAVYDVTATDPSDYSTEYARLMADFVRRHAIEP